VHAPHAASYAMAFVPASDLGILDSPEEVLSTMTKDGKRRWLYPVESAGRYLTRRKIVGWALIVFFVVLPIVRVGGKPALFLDVARREFTFVGTTFYPTDTFLLMLMLLTAFVGILLFTALFGRVWCGWGCPQTVYLEFVFRPIERLVEGTEHARKKRDDAPHTGEWYARRALKYAAYIVVAALLAHTFVAYFASWDRLIRWMTGDPRDHWGYFVLMAVTTGLIVFDFAIFREQMCTIACPYARLQSVLVDPDSLIVAYDPDRGEPRGRGKSRDGKGDCIDCFACVRTCPTGIDIRDGLQMECVACTQCVDACDSIMDRVGKPKGLIRYASEHELEHIPTKRVRARTVLYSIVFVGLLSAFTFKLATRNAYDVNVGRNVGAGMSAPFITMPDGQIANQLRLRVRNQLGKPVTFTVEAETPQGASVIVIGPSPVPLKPGEMKRVNILVRAPRATFINGTADATFVLRFSDGQSVEEAFPLLGPSR